jgi:hypothetical protein
VAEAGAKQVAGVVEPLPRPSSHPTAEGSDKYSRGGKIWQGIGFGLLPMEKKIVDSR